MLLERERESVCVWGGGGVTTGHQFLSYVLDAYQCSASACGVTYSGKVKRSTNHKACNAKPNALQTMSAPDTKLQQTLPIRYRLKPSGWVSATLVKKDTHGGTVASSAAQQASPSSRPAGQNRS
jgi:hypothetical protein